MINDEVSGILNEAKSLNYEVEALSSVKSGKEATVYRVLLDDQVVAMKLYKKPEERAFKNTDQYLLGKYYKKTSHRKAVLKGNRFSKKLIHDNWVKREFSILEELFKQGASIPEPILHIGNAIFMQFLGDLDTVAPRLCDIKLSKEEAKIVFDKVIETMQIFWNFGIVHADLSEYNILWWNKEVYIIDFPQAIDKRTYPDSEVILKRDIDNIIKFFGKYIEIDINKINKIFL